MDDYEYYYGGWKANEPKKTCSCGCLKTFGENCNIEFHSDWCEYSPNYKKEEAKDETFPFHYD